MVTTMPLQFLLLTLFITTSSAFQCDGVHINKAYYNIHFVKEGVNNIHELAFNRNDNTAYFTFEQIAEVPTRMLGYVNLGDFETGVIEGIRNATGLAIDQGLNRIYVGGSDGLFMINNNNKDKVPEKLPVNDDIRSLFLKDGVVYFVNKRKDAFRFEFGSVSPLFEVQGIAVDKIILDDDNNILFLQNKKLFRVKIGTKTVNSHEKIIVNDLTVNQNYKPYVAAIDGLYVYNKYKYVLDKVGDLKGITKLAFVTSDEPIYAVIDIIVRLTKSSIGCLGD